MTTAVSSMPMAADFSMGMREPSPPTGSRHDGEKGSPTPRKSRAIVTRNGETSSPLPDLKSSDKDMDKSLPLPTSLQSEFIPEDILNALTAMPTSVEKKKVSGKQHTAHTKLPKGGATPANVWNFPGRRRRFQHLTDNPKSLTGAGKDISFLYDLALAEQPMGKANASDPSSVRAAAKQKEESVGVPETLVPSEYHVVRSKGVQHLEYHEEKYSTQLMDPEKRLVSFPSLKPASRYEVLQLQETLDTMLDRVGVQDEDVEVKGPTQLHNLLELIKKEQNIYNIVFHELIRQVSVECTERGQLLSTLRGHYSTLLDKVPRQMKSLHQEVMAQRALDRRLTEELFRFKTSISELTNELSDVREHDKVVTTQAQQAQEELASALAESEKNSSLLSEYHELYELQRRRLEHQVGNLSTERELWSAAAYNLALKVTESNALTTAKRLHVSEKSWSKLANHFTIVLSDRDTEQLSQLQHLVESHRDLTMKFNEQLRKDDVTSRERLMTIKIGIERWLQEFMGTIVTIASAPSILSDATSSMIAPSRASTMGHQVLKAPEKNMIERLYSEIRSWEEILNKEVEKFGGDILLGYEDQMYQVKKLVDRWTEISVQVFNRHKPEDGSDHPDREKLIIMNRDCDTLQAQFHTRVNGENGTARGCIQIANTMESWDTKLNSILNGGAMPMDAEWSRLYELFQDWIQLIDDIMRQIGSSKKEDDKSGKGKPHNPLHMVDVFRTTQKWLTSTTNGIDSQDSKLVEQVSVLHADMVHWMIQVLLRLAPDRDDSPPEAIESAMANAPTIPQIQERATALFDRLTNFSNYITSCCATIVAEEVQKQQDQGAEDADHEFRDLKKLKSECAEWIHTAILLIEELKNMPGYEGAMMTPLTMVTATNDTTTETPVPMTPGMADRSELTMVDDDADSQLPIESMKETPAPAESNMSMSVPATPAANTEPSEIDMSEMQVIGHDDNVRTQSLEEDTKPPGMAPPSRTAVSYQFRGTPASTMPSTPDTNKAYEALAAVKTLQMQLLQTEERAQTAEDRVTELEEQLKTANERMRAAERNGTPINASEPPKEGQQDVKPGEAPSTVEETPKANDETKESKTATPEPTGAAAVAGTSTPTPPPHSPSPTMAGRKTPLQGRPSSPATSGGRKTPLQQGRPSSQSSLRSGASSRTSHRSKKGK